MTSREPFPSGDPLVWQHGGSRLPRGPRGGSLGIPFLALGIQIIAAAADNPANAIPAAGKHLSYAVLSGQTGAERPFALVDFLYGPTGEVEGVPGRWWQLEVRAGTNLDAVPLFSLRVFADVDPLRGADRDAAPRFGAYQLEIPGTDERYDYREAVLGGGLAPAWANFASDFLPHPAPATRREQGAPETCVYLGQTLSLRSFATNDEWKPWAGLKRLDLNRETLVGTGRNFKDAEGKRIAGLAARDYTYVRFKEDDYRAMRRAGMNLFVVDGEQEPWVRGEADFYYRQPWGKYESRYPADLYRANYRGIVMFMDEPAEILFEDANATREARRPSDLAELFGQRTRATYWSNRSYGVWQLDALLRGAGANLGSMRLAETDFPVWETHIEAAYYELREGGAGIVNEARYESKQFNERVAAATGLDARFTPPEIVRFHNALMRGAARSFGKFWGTAIYGQCDPAIAPLALSAAYDMGARYFWFWTSDHDHHVPWPEQIALAQGLKDHAAAAPRRSIYAPPPVRDVAITVPYGFFIACGKAGWDRGFDKSKGGPADQLRRVTRRAIEAMRQCLDRGEDFDFTVDDSRPLKGYRRVIRVSEGVGPHY